jgi:hypothetical protein
VRRRREYVGARRRESLKYVGWRRRRLENEPPPPQQQDMHDEEVSALPHRH